GEPGVRVGSDKRRLATPTSFPAGLFRSVRLPGWDPAGSAPSGDGLSPGCGEHDAAGLLYREQPDKPYMPLSGWGELDRRGAFWGGAYPSLFRVKTQPLPEVAVQTTSGPLCGQESTPRTRTAVCQSAPE